MPQYKKRVHIYTCDFKSDVTIAIPAADIFECNTVTLTQVYYEAPPTWGAAVPSVGELALNFHNQECCDTLAMFPVGESQLTSLSASMTIDDSVVNPIISFYSRVNSERVSPVYMGYITLRIEFSCA